MCRGRDVRRSMVVTEVNVNPHVGLEVAGFREDFSALRVGTAVQLPNIRISERLTPAVGCALACSSLHYIEFLLNKTY